MSLVDHGERILTLQGARHGDFLRHREIQDVVFSKGICYFCISDAKGESDAHDPLCGKLALDK